MFNSHLTWWQRVLCVVVGSILLLLLWEAVLALGVVTPLLLPHPSGVLSALLHMLGSSSFWRDISATVWTWVLGVLIGFLIGATGGIVLSLNRFVWAAAEPWVEFLRSLPSVVLVPMVSLFLGVGASSRLVCSALVVLVMMISTAGTGLRTASSAHLRLATAWRATRWQTVRIFLIPAALSHMAVALRAAIPIALIVAVAADMLIATDAGIGKIIMDALAVFDSPTMYAAVLVVGVLGYLAALLGSAIERVAIHWIGK